MTVWINPIEDGPHSSQVEQDGRIVNKYRLKKLYRTDAGTRPTEADITADVGIVPGSAYFNDANATCSGVTITALQTRLPHLAYHVDIEWATNAPLPNAVSTDPTTRRTVWSIAPQIQSTYIIEDINKKLILNTAGQPFDGGIPVSKRTVSATANRTINGAGWNKGASLALSGKLNSDTYLGALPGTLQVDLSEQEKYEGAYHTIEQTFTLAYDPQGHQPRPVSAGFFQRLSDDPMSADYNKLDRITNYDIGSENNPSDPVQEPEPLDASGIVVPIANRPDDCVFVNVSYFGTTNFAAFGL